MIGSVSPNYQCPSACHDNRIWFKMINFGFLFGSDRTLRPAAPGRAARRLRLGLRFFSVSQAGAGERNLSTSFTPREQNRQSSAESRSLCSSSPSLPAFFLFLSECSVSCMRCQRRLDNLRNLHCWHLMVTHITKDALKIPPTSEPATKLQGTLVSKSPAGFPLVEDSRVVQDVDGWEIPPEEAQTDLEHVCQTNPSPR
eukprot:758381-Hanusia_phi.AAC.7